MKLLARYKRRDSAPVVAIQMRLEIESFSYWKWGAKQTALAGDWLINNQGDVYTVSNDSFSSTYRNIGDGKYQKVTTVLAKQAEADGEIHTQEGTTHYAAGDMIVYNDVEGEDGYAIALKKFHELYELVE